MLLLNSFDEMKCIELIRLDTGCHPATWVPTKSTGHPPAVVHILISVFRANNLWGIAPDQTIVTNRRLCAEIIFVVLCIVQIILFLGDWFQGTTENYKRLFRSTDNYL
jgi:hypothetical protein